jgi:hypothetical protein
MHFTPAAQASPHPEPAGVLVVADWTVDPHAVVAAAGRHGTTGRVGLVVPARLHGPDWAGDPRASCPCAQRQLDAILELGAVAELSFELAVVGDPEPLAAICDALADWPAQLLLLCERHGRLSAPYPLDLGSRARRHTGLAVERVELQPAASDARRRGWLRLRRGHCALPQPQAAA